MGDMGDIFNAVKKEKQAKRAENRDKSAQLLGEREIAYKSNNGGAHLIVEGSEGFIDFWPGTGRWKTRAGHSGFGVFNLIKYIKGSENEQK